MATFFSNEYVDWWSNSNNRVYGTLTGDVSRSGNTVTLSNLRLALTPTQTSWGTSSFSFTVGGTTTTQTISAPPTTIALNDAQISVGATQTSATVSWSGPENSGSFSISFPAGVTPPTNLAISNIVPGTDGFTATVSVSGWGTGGTTSGRLKELSVCTSASASQRKKVQVREDTLATEITVDNTAALSDGAAFTITPNTAYYLTEWASNGATGTGNSAFTSVVTKANAPTVSLDSVSGDTATINYSAEADGGQYPKVVEYSLDDGATWQTGTTISTGAATSGSFTISGLVPGSQTVKTRVTTTAGSTLGDDLIINTTFTNAVSATGQARISRSVVAAIAGQTRISKATVSDIIGEARIRTSGSTTLTGRARIGDKVYQSAIAGRTRIKKTATTTLAGIAYIYSAVHSDTTISGRLRTTRSGVTVEELTMGSSGGSPAGSTNYGGLLDYNYQDSQATSIAGQFTVKVVGQASITGKITIESSLRSSINGRANVLQKDQVSISGRAKVKVTTGITLIGRANVMQEEETSITGQIRVVGPSTTEVEGIARVQVTSTAEIEGKAKICYELDKFPQTWHYEKNQYV